MRATSLSGNRFQVWRTRRTAAYLGPLSSTARIECAPCFGLMIFVHHRTIYCPQCNKSICIEQVTLLDRVAITFLRLSERDTCHDFLTDQPIRIDQSRPYISIGPYKSTHP